MNEKKKRITTKREKNLGVNSKFIHVKNPWKIHIHVNEVFQVVTWHSNGSVDKLKKEDQYRNRTEEKKVNK